jgi:hypothetical protein
MPTGKPRYTVIVDDEMLEKIDDYRFKNRFGSRSAATSELIKMGMNALKPISQTEYGSEPSNQEFDSNSGFVEKLNQFSRQLPGLKREVKSDQAAILSMLLPFIEILGYDAFDADVVVPYYTFRGNGTRVIADLAVFQGKEPHLFFEFRGALGKFADRKMPYYMQVQKGNFLIFTDGIKYRVYALSSYAKSLLWTDDYVEFDLTKLDDRALELLEKLSNPFSAQQHRIVPRIAQSGRPIRFGTATGTGDNIVDIKKLTNVAYPDMKTYWDVHGQFDDYVVLKDFASIHDPKYVCAGIGTDSTYYTRCDVKYIPRTPETERFANSLMFPVAGDSMEPLFHDGDIALVWEQPEAADGDICVFKRSKILYLKKKEGKYLVSLNQKLDEKGKVMYQPIKIDSTFEAVGVVIGKM